MFSTTDSVSPPAFFVPQIPHPCFCSAGRTFSLHSLSQVANRAYFFVNPHTSFVGMHRDSTHNNSLPWLSSPPIPINSFHVSHTLPLRHSCSSSHPHTALSHPPAIPFTSPSSPSSTSPASSPRITSLALSTEIGRAHV